MDLKQLEALVWVAKLGSFSKAGEQLFLTQPTISSHISSLEKELGVRLIERTTKAVYPSKEGTKLLAYATEILRLRDEALAALAQVSSHTPKLCELFGIDTTRKRVISLVGAGGKTTFLFALAHELAGQGKRVAVTTTTHIFRPDVQQCTHVVTDGDLRKIDIALSESNLVTVGASAENDKLAMPAAELLRYLQNTADFLLIEADGSRCLPIKVPNDREPVIYSGTDQIIAVGGLSCLGKPIGQVCHRAPIAQQLLNVTDTHLINAQDMARLLYHSYGHFGSQLTVALNQADNGFLRGQAGTIAGLLMQSGVQRVAVTSFLSKQFEYYSQKRSAAKC
ncbi:selenium cofactor biosynthesis protein YqeC [Hydrogenoanaerobacterium sp.]|uniref:selenium cofactor biosynthesis protein YqeC n=1 Tax=Hydrogenoanaerobacterium sp. TaxID=2953763 RepID=UPI00289FC9C2|nr:selenium cofactor biosynthesis protein YqeC [Hydrogenoanaerobacterium sp.]